VDVVGGKVPLRLLVALHRGRAVPGGVHPHREPAARAWRSAALIWSMLPAVTAAAGRAGAARSNTFVAAS
jgi:hypothetical protein